VLVLGLGGGGVGGGVVVWGGWGEWVLDLLEGLR